jgi:hypothetical protein
MSRICAIPASRTFIEAVIQETQGFPEAGCRT